MQTFFPAFTASINNTSIGTILQNHMLLPDIVVERCTEVTIPIGSGDGHTTLRQPILLFAALLGAAIGVRGAWSLPNKYWSLAFGAFAIMNIDAILLHCLWPSLLDNASDTYPEQYPFLWMIDTYMTGVSSVGLLFASLERCSSQVMSRSFWILQAVGIVSILWFYVDPTLGPTNSIATSLPLELWYLIPPMLAGVTLSIVMFGELIWNHKAFRCTTGHVLFICGALLGVLGFGLDGFWCRIAGTLLADLLTSMTLVFLGCDLSFWGIYQWIQSSSESKNHVD